MNGSSTSSAGTGGDSEIMSPKSLVAAQVLLPPSPDSEGSERIDAPGVRTRVVYLCPDTHSVVFVR